MGTEMAAPEQYPQADDIEKNKLGCGIGISNLYNGVFRRPKFWPRRTSSTSSIPANPNDLLSFSSLSSYSKRRRGGSDDTAFLEAIKLSDSPRLQPPPPQIRQPDVQKPITKQSHSNSPRSILKKSNLSNGLSTTKLAANQNGQLAQGKKVPKETIGLSGELDMMIIDHQRSKSASGGLVRASSSNVMLLGHLGNLRQPGARNSNTNGSNPTANSVMGNGNVNSVMGNIVRNNNKSSSDQKDQQSSSGPNLCRALSTSRYDSEALKEMGNEEYKKGKFVEALALYDRAIAMNPDKASYRSNKSAALTGLGRILDAALECKEAIRIDPSYHRAHHRLATLYLRLGDAETALYHFKNSGKEAKSSEINQAQTLQTHLKYCNEAKKQKDWNAVLQRTRFAISSCADSAPQIFALQAQALLKLSKHEEADASLMKAPVFDVDACTEFFGPTANAQLLQIRAQVDLASGRFDYAVALARKAVQLDSSNKEVNGVLRKARAVVLARSHGNELFKASKFAEASAAYSEGLEYDPYNSILLCNRATCRSKLGQFERAVEDCTSALNVRPSYTKARLRRADCNGKLERWQASIQDYEKLIRETPGNEEVSRALFDAQVQLKKQRGEDVEGMKFGTDVIVITNHERFRHFITSPGMSVVLFCNKHNDKQGLNLLEKFSKKYPSVNFLKVDVEEHPYISKSEEVSAGSLPTFKIYKNGSRVQDIPGNNHELLERSVQYYTT
ncbi:hypothetical protein MKX01_037906 [Papaver californicum]|nr:hypothetical protein MKX01_037906 [Papaver californicum]